MGRGKQVGKKVDRNVAYLNRRASYLVHQLQDEFSMHPARYLALALAAGIAAGATSVALREKVYELYYYY